MADIITESSGGQTAAAVTEPAGQTENGEIVALIELLFFAYRDFVSDPDQILADDGFGRAHHRVVHFVGRNPGMRVAELLDILGITKQSLSRVLRELIDKGFVCQRAGARDRRQRLLYLTPEGSRLHERLITPQIARIRGALAACSPQAHLTAGASFRTMLFEMIDADDRQHVLGLIGGDGAPREGQP